jgi:hypothetical protein
MRMTFRAELMPGRETDERTFEIERVLSSGRIELTNLTGEHALTEFEPVPGLSRLKRAEDGIAKR